jgi:hypothetical protein
MREGRVRQKEARVDNFYDTFDYDVRSVCCWWWFVLLVEVFGL